MTNPRVLFLDEPTSGLDSFTANEVRLLIFSHVRLLSGMYTTKLVLCFSIPFMSMGCAPDARHTISWKYSRASSSCASRCFLPFG